MAVDLGNLVDSLKAEISAPGEDAFPSASDDDYLNRLINGFWNAVLDGLITGYTVDDSGILTPTTGTTDLNREFQQIIVFYAGMDAVLNAIRSLNTMTRSVAGPVEFEVQKSANTLRDILKALLSRRDILLTRLSDLGMTKVAYVDGIIARDLSMRNGDQPYVSGVQGSHRGWGF